MYTNTWTSNTSNRVELWN